FLSGLFTFAGTRLRARLMVPAIPQPGGDTGGAWKRLPRIFFFAIGALNVSAVSVAGVVQVLVAWPTHTVRVMMQVPCGRASASHVGSPSVQLSADGLALVEMLAAAGPVSHTAAQLFFLPGTNTA